MQQAQFINIYSQISKDLQLKHFAFFDPETNCFINIGGKQVWADEADFLGSAEDEEMTPAEIKHFRSLISKSFKAK